MARVIEVTVERRGERAVLRRVNGEPVLLGGTDEEVRDAALQLEAAEPNPPLAPVLSDEARAVIWCVVGMAIVFALALLFPTGPVLP